MTKKPLGLCLAATAALAATTASAHHSFAMFDVAKEIELKGTVTDFQYTNPHSWLVIDVAGPGGAVTHWGFEAEGPSTLLRAGIKRSTFMQGEKITVRAHPLKDGRTGGALILATKADGTIINPKTQESAPKTDAAAHP